MLKSVKSKVLFALVLLAYLFVTINILLETPVSNSNIYLIDLHLKQISWNRPSRGSLNYDLYVLENNNHYKVGADWADCFYYSDFTNKVKPGDKIKLGIKRSNGFFADDLKLLVSINANNESFLDMACVNGEIANEKITLPFYGLGGLFILYILLYYQDTKQKNKREK